LSQGDAFSGTTERQAKMNALIGAGILKEDGSLKDLDLTVPLSKVPDKNPVRPPLKRIYHNKGGLDINTPSKSGKEADPPSPEETP
jgi:hypothetical protein